VLASKSLKAAFAGGRRYDATRRPAAHATGSVRLRHRCIWRRSHFKSVPSPKQHRHPSSLPTLELSTTTTLTPNDARLRSHLELQTVVYRGTLVQVCFETFPFTVASRDGVDIEELCEAARADHGLA
jgi:hypothetical protein